MDGTIQRKKPAPDIKSWKPQTRAVRGGQVRSNFDETSEALFLTSGYAYNSAEEAEATFKGESTHFQYSRFGNPTVAMFENRLAALEGAEACRRHLDRHVGGVLRAARAAQGRRPHRRGAPAVRLVPLHRERAAAEVRHQGEFVDGGDLTQWEKALSKPTQAVLFEIAVEPDARHRRRQGGVRSRAQGGRQGRARQRLRHADPAAAARVRRRRRGPLGDQVHRRPGPRARRRDPGQPRVHHRQAAADHPQHRSLDQPVQCLGVREGPGDARPAHRPPLRQCPQGGRRAGAESEDRPRALSRPARPSAARAGGQADVELRRRRHLRHQGRQVGDLRDAQPPAADRHLQQPGRRQEHGHPSGDDHAHAHRRRGAGQARHRRRHRAHLGRPRGCRRRHRRPDPGARR